MDVNLTISLIRGQMGVVIEKAVTVAVETVLGEMMKVVSIKFDEFRKEMNAKEKENENIRQMLEISRCQMRAMRKYLSVSTAKDDRQSHPTQRQQVNQFESVRVPEVYLDQSTFSQPLSQGGMSNGPLCRRAVNSQALSEVRDSNYTHRSLMVREDHNVTAHKTKDPIIEPMPMEDPPQTDIRLIASDGTTTLLTSIKQEVTDPPEPTCSLQEVGESSEVPHGRKPDQPGAPVRSLPDASDLPELSPGEAGQDALASAPPLSSAASVVKEETTETEMAPIKQEPQEVEVEVEGDSLGPSKGEGLSQGAYLEGTGTQQITAGASMGQPATYYSPMASSSTYAASQPCLPMVTTVSTATGSSSGSSVATGSAAGAGVRQGRPWLRDLGLYEQYKQARAELRRRSQLRRKQLEQDLPQALLADLVKERREKTRLRVARWRAKRKLQACLMGAPQGAAGALTPASAAAAASTAAAQVGQSAQRAAGLQMQVQMQTTGVAGQQQRLGGRQHQHHQQQQGRAGLQYGGRVGGPYPFGAGSQQGLPAVSVAVSGDAGRSGGHSLSAQSYGAGDRFAQQRATYLQHGTQGTDTGMYQ